MYFNMSIYRQILRFVILTKNAAGNEYFHLKSQRKWIFPLKRQMEMNISASGNGYFRWWKWIFPLVETDISAALC